MAVFVALGLVLTSCVSTTDPATTLESPGTTLPETTSPTEDPLLRLALPIDPQVRHGTLENGLAYYIRENDSPGGRAELRLVVDVGSAQEDADQGGMAHFLEHMMFNGTERFPRNELIGVLEAFGPRFGPDINAFTTFDETVYELSLTTDPELVQLGVDVLREWASRATLTETDVIEERGVVLDEWRLRAQGYGARVNEQIESLILPGSIYEGHDPIGTAESISGTTASDVKRFYREWYRPEHMAVVAVGDFDASEMEQRIVAAFGDLASTTRPHDRSQGELEAPAEPRVGSFVDEEAALGGVTVVWPGPPPDLVTVGDYQRSLAASIGLRILADRLSDDARDAGSPLLSADMVDIDWARGLSLRGVDAAVRGERLDEGVSRVLTEIERIRRQGISPGEFDRSLRDLSALSRQVLDQQDSIQDAQIVAQIIGHHLAGADLMSAEQRFDVESDIIGRLTIDDVDAALLMVLTGSPSILVVGPDDPGLVVPDETRILDLLRETADAVLATREDVDPGEGSLMSTPDPAPVVSTEVDPRFGYMTMTFDNGATVYLWESDIATERVYARVEGFGGTSRVDVGELLEAHLMTDIVERSGLARYDEPSLRRLLSGRLVEVHPWISETRQGLEGDSATSDVEWLFQLIDLTMTRPRFDDVAVEAVLDELRAIDTSREVLPDVLFEEALGRAYYGDDPRYVVVPTAAEIDAFDVATAERLFHERFSDPGQLAFVFVGDFDTSEMADLAARYIGTLPGGDQIAGFVDHQPLPPRRVQVLTIEAGSDEQGSLSMFFTNELEGSFQDRLTERLVELILSTRLRERIREELSATYSISATIDLQREPDPFAEGAITATGDPRELDEISSEVITALSALQETGPTAAEFATAVAQLGDEIDLIDNVTLAEGLLTAHLYPDQPVAELAERYDLLGELTPEHVRRLAGIVFDLGQRIEVRLVPRR